MISVRSLVEKVRRRYRRRRLRTASKRLKPSTGVTRGNALLAYRIEPFLFNERRKVYFSHTMYAETVFIATILLDLGFEVDVIGFENQTFLPKKKYDVLISSREHFQRYAELTGPECLKIAHLDTSHWKVNNSAGHGRCIEVNRRRPGVLESYRRINPNAALEYADLAVILGNDYTIGTYETDRKPIHRIPVPGIRLFPEPDKDFDTARNRFLWFGSEGFVQKGLDLVLEAFSEMPELSLTVCGPMEKEKKGFVRAYERELFHTPNITTLGWVDVRDREFLEVVRSHVAMVYPSCAEGQAGSVVTCMHAGLIPIVSMQSGIDISREYGMIVDELSVEGVKAAVRSVVALPAKRLSDLAYAAWAYAREHHTEENYKKQMAGILREYLEGTVSPDRKALSGRSV